MNEFKVEGTVQEVEERRTQKGAPWWLTMVQAGEETVPVALFRGTVERPPKPGDRISVTGRLRTWNGFLQLKPERVHLGDEVRETAMAGGRPGKPVTEPFEDDGGLPF